MTDQEKVKFFQEAIETAVRELSTMIDNRSIDHQVIKLRVVDVLLTALAQARQDN